MEITLANGKGVAIIDDSDFPLVKDYSWHIHRAGNKDYARAWINGKREYMHRLILPGVILIDHGNGNGLDNTRSNLRPANKSLNAINTGLRSDNRSGIKGVRFHKASGKWIAETQRDGKRFHLGLHTDPEAARLALQRFHRERGTQRD